MRYEQKLQIAFIDLDDIKNPLLGAGQARATYEVGQRLVAMGHRLTVYCSRYPGYKDRTENGITYKHVGLGSKHIRINNIFFVLLIPYYVRKIQADVIIESFAPPFSTLFSPLFTKIPVIGLPSMFNAHAFAQKYHLPFYVLERIGSKYYRYFMPYSKTDSNKMKKLNPSVMSKIIPQGVDSSYLHIPHKAPKHILFLSRLDIEQKGIDLLLQAYAKVTNKIGYPLLIAGHGPDEKKIQKLIDTLGLTKKVRLVGPAYGNVKKKLLSESIYVAFPSRHDEFSLWALEALASGLPLVAFDLPESAWMNKDVSLKAKPFIIEQYASLLLKAGGKRLNTKMRKNARRLAKTYTWEKVANMFSEFIHEVLEYERRTYGSY